MYKQYQTDAHYKCSSVPFLFLQLVTRTKKIFVGGLSVNTTIEDVKQYFDQFGKVRDVLASAKPVAMSNSNQSKGYFVNSNGST